MQVTTAFSIYVFVHAPRHKHNDIIFPTASLLLANLVVASAVINGKVVECLLAGLAPGVAFRIQFAPEYNKVL